jgi:hypothetical protein
MINLKPRVFLSHSKNDKDFIEKLANDLRSARIDVWYDDWEIPSGQSFRRQIFEDGIPNCDLFFIFLTPLSSQSYWVNRELDAAFIADAEKRGGFLALFVDADATRPLLSLDLQALHSPVLNQENYLRPLSQLISRAWEGYHKRKTIEIEKNSNLKLLQVQKELAERDLKIFQMMTSSGANSVESIIGDLRSKQFKVTQGVISLAEIFLYVANSFAAGASCGQLEHLITHSYFARDGYDLYYASNSTYHIYDFTGPLILKGVVKVQPPQGDYSEILYLTDVGINIVHELSKG